MALWNCGIAARATRANHSNSAGQGIGKVCQYLWIYWQRLAMNLGTRLSHREQRAVYVLQIRGNKGEFASVRRLKLFWVRVTARVLHVDTGR